MNRECTRIYANKKNGEEGRIEASDTRGKGRGRKIDLAEGRGEWYNGKGKGKMGHVKMNSRSARKAALYNLIWTGFDGKGFYSNKLWKFGRNEPDSGALAGRSGMGWEIKS